MNQYQTTRRSALKLTGAAMLSGFGGIQVLRAQTAASASAAQPRMIVVMLRGAMDGLSLVVPFGENAYYQSRSTIAIPRPGEANGLLPLNNLFGLHPAFAPLMPYWESRQLAFIHASGSPDPTRSHFDAQDYMESATPGRKSTPDGWLNRLSAVLAGPHSTPASQRLQAVNLGPTMPRIFSGPAEVASLGTGNRALAKGSLDRPELA